MIAPKNANNAYTVCIKRQTKTFSSHQIAVAGLSNVDNKRDNFIFQISDFKLAVQ